MLPHHRTQPRNTEHLPDALGRHHCNAVPTVHTECTRTCMQRLFHWNSCELPDDTQNQRQPFQVRAAVVVRKNTYNPTVRSRRRNAQRSSSRCNCFFPDKMSTFGTIHQTTLGLQLQCFPHPIRIRASKWSRIHLQRPLRAKILFFFQSLYGNISIQHLQPTKLNGCCREPKIAHDWKLRRAPIPANLKRGSITRRRSLPDQAIFGGHQQKGNYYLSLRPPE